MTTTPRAGEGSDLRPTGIRCSDGDRERTGERLRTAAGEGRLTMTELDERLGATYAATYQHEFAVLTTDLPATAAAAPTGWWAILALLWTQLAAEFAILVGRSKASTRRRLTIVGVLVVLLALVGGVIVAAFHGLGAEGHGFGPEGRGFGPDGPFGR